LATAIAATTGRSTCDGSIRVSTRTDGALRLVLSRDPRTVNTSPAGLARYSSLRSWLSQWSYDLSNAKGPKNAARIRRTPVLQVENLADDAVPASHNPTIRSALATSDKEYVGIEGATHYYQNQPAQLHQCISAVLDWSRRKGLLAG
jgi:hypothetical protein